MPTYAQLQAESWWGREIVTPELDWLGDELCRRTGRPRSAFGTKGNNRHLRGAHRSQEWILKSRYCTNRRYTVQSGLTSTQARHIAGADFVPGEWGTSANRRLMAEQTGRLMAAMKAGRLNEVRELFGTTNGRTVTGWNNVENRYATSDDSHLEHWHLTLDRRHCANRSLMDRILAIALGEDDMSIEDVTEGLDRALPFRSEGVGEWARGEGWGNVSARALLEYNWSASTKTERMVTALLAAQEGLDTAAILARIDEHAAAEAQRDQAAASEWAELRALVERGLSGELDAAEVVRLIGERLSGQG